MGEILSHVLNHLSLNCLVVLDNKGEKSFIGMVWNFLKLFIGHWVYLQISDTSKVRRLPVSLSTVFSFRQVIGGELQW